MALKISELTKKEQEAILKDKNLVLCPNCSNIVLKTDCYCGLCGKRLCFTDSETTSTKS
jgi:hypothetical protein